MKKWKWSYLLAGLLLAMVWYEFWQSSRYAVTPDHPSTSAASDVPIPAHQDVPVTGGTEATSDGRLPSPMTSVSPEAVTPTNALVKENNSQDMELIARLTPPITLNVSNAPLTELAKYLNTALGPAANIRTSTAIKNTFTLNVQDKPLWEVFAALAAQNPLELNTSSSAGELFMTQTGTGFRRFVISGPVILVPKTFSRSKTGAGTQVNPTSRYTMQFLAAVDPRIILAKPGALSILEAADDTGRPLDLSTAAPYEGRDNSNVWAGNLLWNAPDFPHTHANFKCEIRFVAELSSVSSVIQDVAAKVGDTFDAGSRQVRLTRFEVSATQISFSLTPLSPGDQPLPITAQLFDSKGASSRILNITSNIVGTTIPIANMTGPFHLELRVPSQVKEFSFPLELKDIPIP